MIRRVPQLAAIGRWYAKMPTSSVAAERSFAVMRRVMQTKPSVSSATLLDKMSRRINSWLLDKMYMEVTTELPKWK